MSPEFFKSAAKTARRSPQLGYKVGCCIVKNGRIVGSGVNHVPNGRLQSLFSMHAEIHCLSKLKHLNLKGAEAYIVNIAHSGNVRMAKPCITCAVALAAAGIRVAHYTIDKNNNGVVDLYGEIDSELFYRATDGLGYRNL